MSNADKITDFAIGKLNAIFDGVQHAMPTVTKYALEVTSLNCLFQIIPGFILLLVSGTAGYCLYRLIKLVKPKWGDWYEAPYRNDYRTEASVGIFVLGLITFVSMMISMGFLLDFWAWVGIFHPDLYLIHMALQKVTG